jgi:mannitol/fructose-specific phosphotransferase system IIA component (Ntr-type)
MTSMENIADVTAEERCEALQKIALRCAQALLVVEQHAARLQERERQGTYPRLVQPRSDRAERVH